MFSNGEHGTRETQLTLTRMKPQTAHLQSETQTQSQQGGSCEMAIYQLWSYCRRATENVAFLL